MNRFQVNKDGYYGEFGGMYVPEMLRKNVEDLKDSYLEIINREDFQKEFISLLNDYAGRPTPLYHAKRLSEKYGCKIYLKREDLNHTGSHKINNALGQALLARKMGKNRIIAETGAGQHGVAAATVCALMNMECVVYMGETDIRRQQLNVKKMEMLGAKVVSVKSGSQTLTEAVDEALLDWCTNPSDTFYIIGSAVGPHPYPDMVARFQSIISKEIKKQLKEKEGYENPDYLIACIGGGSNAAGTVFEYISDEETKIILAEAAGKGVYSGKTAATLTLGKCGILHGSKSLVIQNEEGKIEEPYSISAGLDYPGVGPLHASMVKAGRSEVVPVSDTEALKAALELSRLEGIIPALESSHALGVFRKKKFKADDVIVLCLSGRGDKDMDTFIDSGINQR